MNPDKPAQDQAIAKAIEILGEHFEAVQILATATTDDGGTTIRLGNHGNYYARKGMIVEWLNHDHAEEIAAQIVIASDQKNE